MIATPTRRYAAELLGTFLLALTVALSVNNGLGPIVPIIAGFTLALIVYMLGGISGAHVNPAITIALLTTRRIKVAEAVPYIAAQLLGAILAAVVVWFALPSVSVPEFDWTLRPGIFEALGTAVFAFGVSTVASGRATQGTSGIIVGGSLMLGILLASVASLGILNPAVALSLRVFDVWYMAGPLVGALVGAWLHQWIAGLPIKMK